MDTVAPTPGGNDGTADPASEPRVSRGLFVFAALIFVGVVVALGAGLGDIAGKYVADHSSSLGRLLGFTIDFGSSALAVTLLAATAKDAVAVFGNIPDYYEKLKKRAVLQDSLKVFVAAFAVMFASNSISALAQSREEPDLSVEELSESQLTVAAREPLPVASFPVLFVNGTLVNDDKQAADHMHVARKAWDKGVDVSDGHIGEIVAVLNDCTDVHRAHSVQLKVFGYSSSKEVNGTGSIEESNSINTRLANKRASNVHEKLRKQLEKENLQDHVLLDPPVIWHDYEGMVAAHPVMDRIGDKRRRDLEDWSRRADVHLTRAGKCDRLDILRKTRVIRGQPPAQPNQSSAASSVVRSTGSSEFAAIKPDAWSFDRSRRAIFRDHRPAR
jgi:hypothetical protein